ncbi:MAG: PAS domain-containing protein, partial [Anaerolineales bacterium]
MSDALNPADLTSENAELRARLAETEAILLTIRHGVAEAPVISTPPAERQQTEAEVRRQEEQLRLITDAIPALIAYVDAQQRYQFNNQAYEQWFGDRPEELKGRHLRDVLGQAAYTTLLPYIEKALGGQPTMYEQWVPYEDGGLRYIHATYIPHVGPNGETLGFYALVNDITERKQPEEALRASEERFRALANAVPSIVWTAAPDGSITFANDQWFHYVGITPEQNAREWPELVLHPDDYERCVAEWTRALREGTEYRIEVRNRRYDGVHRWFQTRAVPV